MGDLDHLKNEQQLYEQKWSKYDIVKVQLDKGQWQSSLCY